MKMEVGKTYVNSLSGKTIRILKEVNTHRFGKRLLIKDKDSKTGMVNPNTDMSKFGWSLKGKEKQEQNLIGGNDGY